MAFFRRRIHKQTKDTALAVSLQLWSGSAQTRSTAEVMQAFKDNGHLQSIVTLIADSISGAQWTVHIAHEDGNPYRDFRLADLPRQTRAKALKSEQVKELRHHELLELLACPSEGVSGRQTLRLIAIHMLLVGNSYLLLKRNQLGVITGFQVLPPQAVYTLPTSGSDFYGVSYESLQGQIPKSEIVHLKLMDPAHPLGFGVGLGNGVSTELDTYEASSQVVKNAHKSGGAPLGWLGFTRRDTDEEIDPRTLKEQQAKINGHRGPENAGAQIQIVEGQPHFVGVNVDLSRLQANEIAESTLERLSQVYRVPPELIGKVGSASRATAEVARYSLSEFVAQPLLELIRDELQTKLVPLIDDTAILHFETLTPEDKDRRLSLMQNPVTAPSFRLNEVRIEAGFEPDENLEGKYILPAPGSKDLETE